MKRRVFALVLSVSMLITLGAACGNDPVTSKPNKTTTKGTTTTTVADDSTTTTMDDGTTTTFDDTTITDPTTGGTVSTDDATTPTAVEGAWTTTSTTASPIKQPSGKAKTLYVKDFGAKGDGVTDDGVAIMAAVAELRNSPKGSTLIFEKNKTYYYKDNGTSIKKLFYFEGNEGLTIKGDNTLIKLGGTKLTYAGIYSCKDITIEGINFDYAEYKPAWAGKALEVNVAEGWAIVTADRDIHMDTGDVEFPPHSDWFGVVPYKTGRYHMYLSKYEMLDAAQRKVKVYFNTSNGMTMSRLQDEELVFGDGFVLPMPGTGNLRGDLERAFSIEGVENFTMRNCNIYSTARHGFSMNYNTGKFLFENVNCVRAPYDQELKYTSWADFYHLLHNRAVYKWVNCKNEWNYDDVFNISSSTMYVDKVYSKKDIVLRDHAGAIDDLQAGDTVTIISVRTGELLARTKIKSIISQTASTKRIKLVDELPSITGNEYWYAWSDTFCAPGSQFIGCELDGTFRARTQLTMTDCRLQNRRFWIGLETMGAEGPLAQNILFKNCEFVVENNWEITSNNSTKGGYHLEGIVFEGCTGMENANMLIGKLDEVTIR